MRGAALTVCSVGGDGEAGGEPSRSARPQLHALDGGSEQPRKAPPLRVLVADDNASIRYLLSTLLSLEPDFEVAGEASTGTEAVALAEAAELDLLVLDLSMPELDGLEVIERLSASRPRLRIVVYTGLTRDGVEERARELGARDVVTKGVSPAELIERLRSGPGVTRTLIRSIESRTLFEHRSTHLRMLPFAAAYVVAYCLYPFDSTATYGPWFAGAVAATALALAAIAVVVWERLPWGAQIVPLLAFLLSVACLREAHGGARSGYAPLVLVPVVWAAIFGRRRVLGAVIAAAAVTIALPPLLGGAPAYPPGEFRRALVLLLVATLVGTAIQALIGALLRAEADLTRLRADEIHDDLVQVFAVAQLALDAGDAATAARAVSGGLVAAQSLAADMLDGTLGDGLRPGSLRRTSGTQAGDGLTPAAGRARAESP